MKIKRIFYWTATILLAAMMLGSGTAYLIKTADVSKEFTALGFPLYIIVPLGIAKAIAATVLLNNQYKKLVEWAYAGLFFDSYGKLAGATAISHFPINMTAVSHENDLHFLSK